MSLKAKIVLIFTALAILGGGFIAYSIYQVRVSKGLAIQITGPEKAPVGVPFEAKINVANSSDNLLEQVLQNERAASAAVGRNYGHRPTSYKGSLSLKADRYTARQKLSRR